MGICDICNEWTSVAHPKDYRFPKFTINRDKFKIYNNLMAVLQMYMSTERYGEAINVVHEIDSIIHEILEADYKEEDYGDGATPPIP